MKVLITGCTAMQIDSPRKQNDCITSLPAMKAGFISMGYDVEWRAVNLEEDLDEFDKIIISLAPFASWGTRYMGACLVALYNYQDKVILTADDWQCKGIWSSCKGMVRRPEYMDKTLFSHWPDMTPQSKKKMIKMVHMLAAGDWENPTIVPAHAKGNHSLLGIPARNLQVWDPSPYIKRYPLAAHTAPFGIREKRWICASLTNKVSWLDKQVLNWSVTAYGNVRKGQQKLPEGQLALEYCKVWGVLSPRHNVSGSGWWRCRYNIAADAGAIVAGDPVEGAVLGTSYTFSIAEVESFNEAQLEALHAHQVADLRRESWSPLQFKLFFGKLCSNK